MTVNSALVWLRRDLREHGGALTVLHGLAKEEIPALAKSLQADAVFTNHDYEPAANARFEAVTRQRPPPG